MPDSRVVHALVEQLYDAALAPERWPATLAAVAAHVGADALGLSFAAYDRWRDAPPLSVGIDPTALPTYLRIHHDDAAWSTALRNQPIGEVREVMPAGALHRTVVYNEWLRAIGLEHVLHVLLWRDPPRRAGLLVGRARTHRPFRPQDMALLQPLVPHLQRAIEIGRRLRDTRALGAVALDVIDGLPVGVILVDRRARVVLTNRYADAVLTEAHGLVIRERELRVAMDLSRTAALHRLIAACADADATPGGGVLAVRRPTGRPLQCLVAPLGELPMDARHVGADATVFVTDPDRLPDLDLAWIAATFDLTPAQARLATRLVQGRTVEQIAVDLGLATTTIRDRVKQIFARTGTSRQAELVQLLLRSPGAFRTVPTIRRNEQ